MTSKDVVLVTGASGFIGAHIVKQLLLAGYAVRGTSRSAKAEALRESYNTPDFEVAVVDDLVKGDLAAALRGVSSLVHLASPQPTPDVDIVEIAVEGTMNIIRQAYALHVHKIIVISSASATFTKFPEDLFDSSITCTANDWNKTTAEEARKPSTTPPAAYTASKALAESAAWRFSESHPELDLTTLLPSFVYGPLARGQVISASSKTDLSTNGFIYALISGPEGEYPQAGTPHYVDVRDVARAVVLSLSAPAAPPGERKRIILSSGYFWWHEVVQHLAQVRPNLKGRLLERGEPKKTEKSGAAGLDIKNAQKYLGMSDFIGWKQCVEDTVDSLLQREATWTT